MWLALVSALACGAALAPPVQVFDGAFGSAACDALHAAASARGLGHTLFDRSLAPRSVLEEGFDSFLTAVGDASPLVEYWCRQEWRHIEAHADVDEALASSSGTLRFPESAHVLYARVGSEVQGPTCVWEPDAEADAHGDGRFGSLTTVPAVAGRVLRFRGDLVHAVPRPADVWLAPFVINKSGREEDFCRSVILFNTWGAAPLDVPLADAAEPPTPRGAATCALRPGHAPAWSTPGGAAERGAGDTAPMKLWLLGDRNRRGRIDRTLKVDVRADATLAALVEPSRCTRLARPAPGAPAPRGRGRRGTELRGAAAGGRVVKKLES